MTYMFENLMISGDRMDKFLGEKKVLFYILYTDILIFFSIIHIYVEIRNPIAYL